MKWFKKFWMKGMYLELKNTIIYEKDFFDKDNNLIYKRFSWINKERIVRGKLSDINKSMHIWILNQGIKPTGVQRYIIFPKINKDSFIHQLMKKMGWKGNFPIEIELLYERDEWILFSVKFSNINISSSQKLFSI
jgi:hypothetical protein